MKINYIWPTKNFACFDFRQDILHIKPDDGKLLVINDIHFLSLAVHTFMIHKIVPPNVLLHPSPINCYLFITCILYFEVPKFSGEFIIIVDA